MRSKWWSDQPYNRMHLMVPLVLVLVVVVVGCNKEETPCQTGG